MSNPSKKISDPKDLDALKDKARTQLDLRVANKEMRLTVHLGTCGIAAGGRDVLSELMRDLDPEASEKVTVQQTGCAGLCDQEPMMTIRDSNGREYRYVKLDKHRVREIVEQHVVGGRPIEKYLAK